MLPDIAPTSSDIMKAMVAAISSGRPERPTRFRPWVRARSRAVNSGVAAVQASIGVSTGPGQTQLTRIPSEVWSTAIARVSPIRPAFDAQYAGLARHPTRANCDPTLTTAPLPDARRWGIAQRETWYAPVRFTASTRAH